MINFKKIDGVGKITLNRPEKFNSFVREMALKLQETLDSCKKDDEIRSVMITASGKAFCAGQDLKEATDPNGRNISTIIQEHYNPIILKIRNLNKPVIAAVNGVAAGAGASLALCCDIIVASENASFIQAFSKIGLVPDSGSTYFLPRIVGIQRAAAVMMTAEPISAHEAEKMGMIYKAYPQDVFEKESWHLVSKLAKMPTKALALTKELLNSSIENSLKEQLNLEDKYQSIAANTEDFNEGVKAFLEKRKANFKGK
ncbi:MAG: 2-(1,2-epoxy-1,2-dihydrophenyl)acetyl-CoA isomerase [Flavobacteriales bacterium]|nr:2-(1,2-epoxy-1,2-dihydrophenyl)acetyl-CoA isomerase [Flavobacteriales bacterium]|tara:strand:- start:10753 stop:11523 length:771 start_codon:yes stop_codon:yes gene_type:complete